MNKTQSILLVATLFLSGVAIGALGMHLYYFERHQQMTRHGGGPRGFERAGRHWMFAELGLSEAQVVAIREIVAESHQKSAELRHEMRPRVEELMQETADRIGEVLTPEQRELFERMRERQRQRFDQFLLGPGSERRPRPLRRRPGPPPPP